MITLHLLRHAKPSPPQGTMDVALSETGRADATAIVPVLRSLGVRRIVSSPYRRAIETARPFAETAGIELETDARLREREMPLADGPDEHIQRVRASFDDSDFAPDGGESFNEAAARALGCLRQLVKETPSGLLLVGHGQCLTVVLRIVDKKVGFEFWKSLPTPAIIELTIDERGEHGSFRLLDV